MIICVCTASQPPEDLFPEVFSNDLGLLPGQVHLKTKEDVHPVVMPDRRTPLALRTELQEELKRLEALGVIAKVQELHHGLAR